MGSSQSQDLFYEKYDKKGNVVKKYINNYHAGWVKILDIFFEDERKIAMDVSADIGIPSLYHNAGHSLILKKENVYYDDIKRKLIKGGNIYIATGEYTRLGVVKTMIINVLEPEEITSTIIFGSYSEEKYYNSYYRVLSPDIFSTEKQESHKNCDQYVFLVHKTSLFDFIENAEYEIKATNRFNSKTYVITSEIRINN
jgi:hypothetical protein